MSAIDILILLLFVVSVAYGLKRGVIVQVGAVSGVLLGILACRLFGEKLTQVFAGEGADANDMYVSGVFANVLIFIVAYFAARLVAGLLKTVSGSLRLTVIDRIGGAVFSLFEWFLVFSLLLNIWQAFRPDIDITSSSKLADGRAAAAVMDFAPKVLGSETFKDAVTVFNSIGADKDAENRDRK